MASPAGGVPRSAVLFFELELVELQKGVPEGYMFVWVGDGPDPLFPAMDLDGDKQVPLEEVKREAKMTFFPSNYFFFLNKGTLLHTVKMFYNLDTPPIFSSFQSSSGSRFKEAKVVFGRGLMPTALLRTCLIIKTVIKMARS